jgi:hypothetical protein
MDENKDTKKTILSFLQNNALDLYKKYPGLLNAKYEENPPRLLMFMTKQPTDLLKFEHNGVEIIPEVIVQNIAVVVQEGGAQPAQVIKDSEYNKLGIPGQVIELEKGEQTKPVNPDMAETVYHQFSKEEAKALGISEVIGPHSTSTNQEAFAAWKARFGKA